MSLLSEASSAEATTAAADSVKGAAPFPPPAFRDLPADFEALGEDGIESAAAAGAGVTSAGFIRSTFGAAAAVAVDDSTSPAASASAGIGPLEGIEEVAADAEEVSSAPRNVGEDGIVLGVDGSFASAPAFSIATETFLGFCEVARAAAALLAFDLLLMPVSSLFGDRCGADCFDKSFSGSLLEFLGGSFCGCF